MKNREALTWVILVLSFIACSAATISVPVIGNMLVQRAERRLLVYGRSTFGRPSITPSGDILLEDEAERRYRTPIGMITARDERGVIEVKHPDNDQVTVRIEVRGGSTVNIDEATFPRFSRSKQAPQLTIGLPEGRIRLVVPDTESLDQNLLIHVNTPNGNVAIDEPGTYTTEFSNDVMQVSVYDGHGLLSSDEDSLELQVRERGVLGVDKRTIGPFATEQNLIANSDFSQNYSNWQISNSQPEIDSEEPAAVEIYDESGEAVAHFARDGEGYASSRLQQRIDRSVADFVDMRLNITLRVTSQSLDVCGFQGSECPLTVRLDYLDAEGQPWAWEQGFYAKGDVAQNAPDVCLTCGYPLSLSIHRKLGQIGQVIPLDGTSNLLQFLEQEGIRPDYINALSLISEGHSFAVDVFEVELNVSEVPIGSGVPEAGNGSTISEN